MSKPRGVNENKVRRDAKRQGHLPHRIGKGDRWGLVRENPHSSHGLVYGGRNGVPLQQVSDWLTQDQVAA